MSDRKTYARCGTHCNYETMTKDEILESIASGGKTCFIRGSYNDETLGSILYEYNGVDPQKINVTQAGNILAAAISLIIDSADAETAPAIGSSSWITNFINSADCIFKVWINGKECLVTNFRLVNGSKVKDGFYITIANEKKLEYTANNSNLIKLLTKDDLDNYTIGKRIAKGKGVYKDLETNKVYKVVSASGVHIYALLGGVVKVMLSQDSYNTGDVIFIGYDVFEEHTQIYYTFNGIFHTVKTENVLAVPVSHFCIELLGDEGAIYEYNYGDSFSGYYSNEKLAKRIETLENEVANYIVGDTSYTELETAVNDLAADQEALDTRVTALESETDIYTVADKNGSTQAYEHAILEALKLKKEGVFYISYRNYNGTNIKWLVNIAPNAAGTEYTYTLTEQSNKLIQLSGKLTSAQWNTVDSLTLDNISYTLTEHATTEALETAVSTKADASTVYTKDEVDTKVSELNTAVSNKADASTVYTKDEVDTKVSELNTRVTALESETDADIYTVADSSTSDQEYEHAILEALKLKKEGVFYISYKNYDGTNIKWLVNISAAATTTNYYYRLTNQSNNLIQLSGKFSNLLWKDIDTVTLDDITYTLTEYATKEALDAAVSELNTAVSTKADASTVYTKTEVDAAVNYLTTDQEALETRVTALESETDIYTVPIVNEGTKEQQQEYQYAILEALKLKKEGVFYISYYRKYKGEYVKWLVNIDSCVGGNYYNYRLTNQSDNLIQLSGYILKTNWEIIDSLTLDDITYTLTEYATKEALDAAVSELNTSIANKADTSTVYTKDEVDTKVSELNTAVSNKADTSAVYTKDEVDTKVSDLESSNTELTTKYTELETKYNTLLSNYEALEARLTELENNSNSSSGTTATVEDYTLVVSNATVEDYTLVVSNATVEDYTLII